MSKKIYVGNLNYTTTEDELKELFSAYGTVQTVNIITDRMTNRPRGFAFVEMDDSEADSAIEGLNNKEVGGRMLRVNEAHERKPGGNRRF